MLALQQVWFCMKKLDKNYTDSKIDFKKNGEAQFELLHFF